MTRFDDGSIKKEKIEKDSFAYVQVMDVGLFQLEVRWIFIYLEDFFFLSLEKKKIKQKNISKISLIAFFK